MSKKDAETGRMTDTVPVGSDGEMKEVIYGASGACYSLDGRIKRGGMGQSYVATGPDGPVFIKMQHRLPEDVRERERRALGAVRHPHIIRLYDTEAAGEEYFIATRFLGGGDLDQTITKCPLSPRRATKILEQVSGAVGHIHEAGLVHRDLKPTNIVLTSRGKAKVVDFGLCDKPMPDQGDVLGTPIYMSPEQAVGSLVDHRSDVYSLGATLYEMLTGQPPFEGKTGKILLDKQKDNGDRLMEGLEERGIRPRAAAVVRRAMEKYPWRRYQSAPEMFKALMEALT